MRERFDERGVRVAWVAVAAFVFAGVDTNPGPDEKQAERIFPLVSSGMQALVVVLSGLVLAGRFWEVSD